LNRPNATIDIEAFYEYSLVWLAVSDALLVLPNHENSNGTKMEIEFATERGIPIFYNYGDLIDYAQRCWGYDVRNLTFSRRNDEFRKLNKNANKLDT
jgi:hypothetical protein